MIRRRNRVCRRIAIALTVALLAGQSHAFVLAEESVGDAPQTEISSGEIGADVSSNGNVTDGGNGENTNGTEQGGDNGGTTDQNPGDNENKGDQQDDEDGEVKCVCGMKCVEDAVNMECPVCAADYEACTGKADDAGNNGSENDDPENNDPENVGQEIPDGSMEGTGAVGGQNQCVCETACTEDVVNADCPVCAADYMACAKKTGETVSLLMDEDITALADEGVGTRAGNITHDGIKYVVIEGNRVEVGAQGINAVSGDITIPGTFVEGGVTYHVTSIGEKAFNGCTNLTSVKMPNNVTSIGAQAFYHCSNLSSIEIPEEVVSVGAYAFTECSNLTSVEIPRKVTNIGEYAFQYCRNLASVKVLGSVTSMGRDAFANCIYLADVKMSEGITNIGEYAFCGCLSLSRVEIPKSVTSIGEGAFSYSGLIGIEIPDSVKNIEKNVFMRCSILNSVEISESVVSIGDGAFGECSRLDKLQIVIFSAGKYQFPKVGTDAFFGLPNKREDICFVDKDENELTEDVLIAADVEKAFNEAAKSDDDRNDNTWYGWSYKGVLEGKDTQKVTINAKKDDQSWPFPDCDRIFALSKDGIAFVTDLDAVEGGTYTIYDITGLTADEFQEKSMNTGVPVMVGDADTSATVEYYTVTFCDYDAATGETVYGNDTAWKPQTILKTVERVAEPKTNPAKEGHAFAGWVTAPGGDVKFDFAGTPITEKDTKIYASWTEKTTPVDTYTVTFYDGTRAYGEDTPQKPQAVSDGQKAVRPANPQKPGWQFVEWVTAEGGSTLYDFDTPVTGTTDIYASWVKETAEQLHITATATEGGDIAPKGDISVTKGGEQTFTITPDEGNRIKTVTVDGKDVTGELKDTLARAQAGARYYTFTNVTENHTIHAEFESDGNTPGGGDNPNPGGGGDNPNPGGGDNPTPGGNEGDNQNPGGGSGTGDNTKPGGGSDTGGSGGGNSGDSGGNSGGGDSAGNGQAAAGSETTSLQAGSGAAGTSVGVNTASDGSKAADGSASSATGQTAGTTGSAVSGSALSASGQTADTDGTAAGSGEPGTGDTAHMEVYATIAMIAGLTYLLLYFMEESRGMTEREKDAFVAAFIRWGKKGGAFRKGCAVVAIFCLLAYYHAIGKHLGESGLHEKYLKQTC